MSVVSLLNYFVVYFVNDPMILQIDTTFETYDKFFNLNIDVKKKYAKRTGTTLKNGWDELESERYSYSYYTDTFTEENSFKLNLLK